MKITKRKLEDYAMFQREIRMLKEQIDVTEAEAVSDTVWASSDEIPYDKHIVAIRGYTTDKRRRLIAMKKRREDECGAIERFVESVDDSMMRQILTRRYLEDNTVKAAARLVGYSKSQVDRKLREFFENMRQHAPK